eukprot:scaffold189076_cov36-Tisochrysis_lutea.AAC.3
MSSLLNPSSASGAPAPVPVPTNMTPSCGCGLCGRLPSAAEARVSSRPALARDAVMSAAVMDAGHSSLL